MAWLVNLLVFLTVTMLVVIAFSLAGDGKRQVRERLAAVKSIGENVQEENVLLLPFYERVISPVFRNAGETLGRLAPVEIRATMEKKITYAGTPWKMTFNTLVFLQLMLALLFSGVAFIFTRMVSLQGSSIILMLILTAGAGMLLPVSVINSMAAKRQKEIQKSLPDMLDLLLVSVEAGLGFDMALKRVAEKMPGELSRELTRALEEIRVGKTRAEALRGVVARTGVSDINSFVTAIIQAEQLGSNIARSLDVMAAQMRQKRRQRAEEAAMKAPVKMLFPLVFFIFPALLVVLLGPAALKIIEAFSF